VRTWDTLTKPIQPSSQQEEGVVLALETAGYEGTSFPKDCLPTDKLLLQYINAGSGCMCF